MFIFGNTNGKINHFHHSVQKRFSVGNTNTLMFCVRKYLCEFEWFTTSTFKRGDQLWISYAQKKRRKCNKIKLLVENLSYVWGQNVNTKQTTNVEEQKHLNKVCERYYTCSILLAIVLICKFFERWDLDHNRIADLNPRQFVVFIPHKKSFYLLGLFKSNQILMKENGVSSSWKMLWNKFATSFVFSKILSSNYG